MSKAPPALRAVAGTRSVGNVEEISIRAKTAADLRDMGADSIRARLISGLKLSPETAAVFKNCTGCCGQIPKYGNGRARQFGFYGSISEGISRVKGEGYAPLSESSLLKFLYECLNSEQHYHGLGIVAEIGGKILIFILNGLSLELESDESRVAQSNMGLLLQMV